MSIGNLYKETIWVKYDVEKEYVKLEEFSIKPEVSVGDVTAGLDISFNREYDWKKIEVQFTPIHPGDYKYKKEETKDAYLTIITNDGHVVCNTWYVDKDHSWLVTEDLELRRAPSNEPLEEERPSRPPEVARSRRSPDTGPQRNPDKVELLEEERPRRPPGVAHSRRSPDTGPQRNPDKVEN